MYRPKTIRQLMVYHASHIVLELMKFLENCLNSIYAIMICWLMFLLPELKGLKRQVTFYRQNSVAPLTRRLRKYQWRCYRSFCKDHNLSTLPCGVEQLCIYIVFLAYLMKYLSIVSYLQGIIFKHVVLGLEPPKLSNPHVKSTLSGVKNFFGDETVHKDPLYLNHLLSMYPFVKISNHSMFLSWLSSIFMFRCLLRVGQVVLSPHTLRRDAVEFTDYGFLLRVRSSKTTSKYAPPALVPVNRMPGSKVCAVYWLHQLFKNFPMPLSAPLFSTPKVPSLSYSVFSKHLNSLISKIGLVGNYASHSLRRGGATSMAELGFGVADIKKRGRWKSSCVNRYICQSISHDIKCDQRWVNNL